MNKISLGLTTLLVIAAVNFLIFQKEDTLTQGQTMLLRLAPRDPRSLIQGDYMVLRYALAQEVPTKQLQDKGYLVLSLGGNNLGQFIRLHQGEDLQPGEHLLFYRNRQGLRLGAESFFFQEGDAELYATARYGELKVDPTGASVLVGLRGENFNILGK